MKAHDIAEFESECWVYDGPGCVRRERQRIVCGPSDIVIRIELCGRCGTDQRLFREPHPNVRTPTVLGHELVGRVVAVGSGVSALREGVGYWDRQALAPERVAFRVGQRVTAQARIARYRDGLMLIRNPIENLSFQIPGGFAQYMKVPSSMIRSGSLLPVPDEVSDEEAALVEPAACALESVYATPHAVGVDEDGRHIVRSGLRPGGRALIVGSGTLAMIYGRLARIEEVAEVWFIVRSPEKADLLKSVLGDWPRVLVVPDYSARPLPEKQAVETALVKELGDLTHGELFDDVVLAAPSVDAQRLMFLLLNPDGYGVAVCFAGLHKPCDRAMVDHLHYRMAKAIGTSGCSTLVMETILRWIRGGRLSLKGCTCPHRYTLADDPAEFFQTRADGRKPMLHPWG
ncbi:MAG: alcohol dehydrogenase catalytic domain-containing protein [Kiritimatiellae bacterium]|nr:alcohol dehydrogenase catalytic domain-containing protein [Kiritimatiellia bacterium]